MKHRVQLQLNGLKPVLTDTTLSIEMEVIQGPIFDAAFEQKLREQYGRDAGFILDQAADDIFDAQLVRTISRASRVE